MPVIDPMPEMKEVNLNINFIKTKYIKTPNEILESLRRYLRNNDSNDNNGEFARKWWIHMRGPNGIRTKNYKYGWNGYAQAVIVNEYPVGATTKPKRRYTYNPTTKKWRTLVKKTENKKTEIYPGRPGSMEVANLNLKYPSNNIIKKLKNTGEEYPIGRFQDKWYKYGWNGSAVTAKEYKKRFQIKPSQTYTWNATQSTWLKPRNKNNQSRSKKHSKNKSNENSNSNNNSFPNGPTLPRLLETNFRMGERTNPSPAALPQHYINSNGKGCICHTPATWISLFDPIKQHWTIRSSNLNALNRYRQNNAPKIGMPNEKVFQRADGMVCVCRNWGRGITNNNAVQQLITALAPVGRGRPNIIDQLFQKTRTNAHRKNLLG